MDFLREWEEKLAIKITCSQVSSNQSLGREASIEFTRAMEYGCSTAAYTKNSDFALILQQRSSTKHWISFHIIPPAPAAVMPAGKRVNVDAEPIPFNPAGKGAHGHSRTPCLGA